MLAINQLVATTEFISTINLFKKPKCASELK